MQFLKPKRLRTVAVAFAALAVLTACTPHSAAGKPMAAASVSPTASHAASPSASPSKHCPSALPTVLPSPVKGSAKTFEADLLPNGQLVVSTAPKVLRGIVEDANWLIGSPSRVYRFGGGHSSDPCSWLQQQPGYDGSGLISYLLLMQHLIPHPMVNEEFVEDANLGRDGLRPGHGKLWSIASCDGGAHLDLPRVQLGYWTFGATRTGLSWHLADKTWLKAEKYGHCKFSHFVGQ